MVSISHQHTKTQVFTELSQGKHSKIVGLLGLYKALFIKPSWRDSNKPPYNALLWHVDCSELKAVETRRTQGNLCPSPPSKENLNWGLSQNKGYYQR